jgi:citrate lyase beta subunit
VNARRSLLFAPASRPELLEKAALAGADIVCADLEDAVGPADKDSARTVGVQFLAASAPPAPERALRINSIRTGTGLKDILALRDAPSLKGIVCLPKVESADEVRWAEELLAAYPSLSLAAFVETPRGLEAAADIARASPKLALLVFGAVDFCAELGVSISDEALSWARGRLASAAHFAGVGLLDAPCIEFRDVAEVSRQAKLAKAIGFTGKTSIHPSNISAIHDAFAPTAAEIEQARGIVAAFQASGGAVATWQGKLVELPVVKRMQRILALIDGVQSPS